MVAAKPDCIGQKFGWLKVLGKAEVVRTNGKSRRLWNLECLLCGTQLKLYRGDFDRSGYGQKSCGCARSKGLVKSKLPKGIADQRFGSLVAIRLTGKKDHMGQPTWLMQCDCGKTCEKSKKRLGQGYRLNCGDLSHQPGVHYPPTPNPYPSEASEIVIRYLYLVTPRYKRIDADVENQRMDNLLRVAWTITYRRMQGEDISNRHELMLVRKTLNYASLQVKIRRFVESGGQYHRYTFARYKQIGGMMTDLTSFNEAVSTEGKTQPEVILPKRRIKFRRC